MSKELNSNSSIVPSDVTNDMYDFLFIPKNIPEQNKIYAKKFLVWLSTTEASEIFLKYAKNVSPFKFDYENVEVDEYYKSMISIKNNTEFIIAITDNPLVQMNKITVFPGTGSPYSDMILKNTKPVTILSSNYTYAKQQWAYWEDEAGVK